MLTSCVIAENILDFMENLVSYLFQLLCTLDNTLNPVSFFSHSCLVFIYSEYGQDSASSRKLTNLAQARKGGS